MDLDEKAILKKTLELSQENNKMLHSMKRQMLFGRVFRIIYWVIILGAAVGLYYYLIPYIDSAIGAYADVKGDFKSFGDLFR